MKKAKLILLRTIEGSTNTIQTEKLFYYSVKIILIWSEIGSKNGQICLLDGICVGDRKVRIELGTKPCKSKLKFEFVGRFELWFNLGNTFEI